MAQKTRTTLQYFAQACPAEGPDSPPWTAALQDGGSYPRLHRTSDMRCCRGRAKKGRWRVWHRYAAGPRQYGQSDRKCRGRWQCPHGNGSCIGSKERKQHRACNARCELTAIRAIYNNIFICKWRCSSQARARAPPARHRLPGSLGYCPHCTVLPMLALFAKTIPNCQSYSGPANAAMVCRHGHNPPHTAADKPPRTLECCCG